MRLRAWSIIGIVLLAIGTLDFNAGVSKVHASTIQSDNAAVSIQVQSANGLTDKFPFFKGQVVTLADAGKPINLRVGDRFLLFLQDGAYEFTPTVLDETILKKVTDVEISGSQGVFEALRSGNTKLSAVGLLPCHKTIPACLAPALSVEFTVIVE